MCSDTPTELSSLIDGEAIMNKIVSEMLPRAMVSCWTQSRFYDVTE